jgi:hypothetical protein
MEENLVFTCEGTMFRLNHIQEHEAYRAEMLRQAARRKKIREALAGRRGRVAFYAPAMVGVGKKMMAWGYALQARFTSVPEITVAVQKRST